MIDFKKRLGSVDSLNLSITGVVFLFYLFAVLRSPYKWQPLVVFAAAVGFVAYAVYLRQKRNRKGWEELLLFFYPILFMFLIFESFFMILPWFNPHHYDAALAAMDYDLLGVHPTVWIERFFHPWLTDLLYICYFLYFPLPWFLMGWLARKGKYEALDKTVFVLLLTYYLGYIGYFVVPAMGPRSYEPIMQLQTKDLDGIFLSVPIRRLILFFEANKFDAFPSLHAAVTSTVMIMMHKYNKTQFYIFLPVAVGIFVSVIYCRYHYLVDVFAGILVSLAAVYFGGKIHHRARKKGLDLYYYYFNGIKNSEQ